MSDFPAAVKGLGKVERLLRKLEPKNQKKAIRKAIRKTLKPVHKEAKAEIPKITGALRKSLKIKAIKRKRGKLGLKVTTGTDTSDYQGKGFYGAFWEFGTDRQEGSGKLKMVAKRHKRTAGGRFKKHLKREIRELRG